MKLFSLITIFTLVTYNLAIPSPDTNIQIQHYDGPVYLGNTPNCCPFCNSILKPVEKDTCQPPSNDPQPVYGRDNEPYEITISLDKDIPCENENMSFGKIDLGVPKETCGSILHNDALKSIHNIPVTCKTGTCSPFGTDIYGAPCMCKPLSNYLPINTATQNTCQVPIVTYGGNSNSDAVLVPQKFMYSLILDGEVGSNQNACNSRMYYY